MGCHVQGGTYQEGTVASSWLPAGQISLQSTEAFLVETTGISTESHEWLSHAGLSLHRVPLEGPVVVFIAHTQELAAKADERYLGL